MSNITLEEALEYELSAAYRQAYGKEPSAQWRKALALRAGTMGRVATLDEAADAIGVTRESGVPHSGVTHGGRARRC